VLCDLAELFKPGTAGERAPGIFLILEKSMPQEGDLLSLQGSMIDALLNVAVFAALALCIVGFGALAQKRVL
jgi:hypothetical protein